MRSGSKIWSTIVDYFLVLSAIIGVGFASGKEICVFFFRFKSASILGLIAFGLLYVYLFLIIQYVNKKLEINSYDEFNKIIFGKFSKIISCVLIINFTITSAGMLAGSDYIFETFFGVHYKLPSIVLTIITFLILLGGINKIKTVSNIIVPIMISMIVINAIKNINPQNVGLNIVAKDNMLAVYFGLLFGVNNFVAALPVLFETKLKTKGRLFVILTICLIILLNILVFASNNFNTDMPMLELSSNVSNMFYYIYFTTLIMALFSTLIICSYNIKTIVLKDTNSKFGIGLIVIINLIFSNLGYQFIANYLYVVSAVISGVFVLILIISLIVNLIKHDRDLKNQHKQNIKENVKEILNDN